MRKIKIYTTAGIPGTIETNISTLGELKPLLRQREINYEEMKMLVGETKNELSVDEATLPEGDFKLYLMPAKTKSGVDFDNIEDTLERVDNTVERIEESIEEVNDKLDRILSKLENSSCSANNSVSTTVTSLTAEEQRDMEELKRLAGESKSELD